MINQEIIAFDKERKVDAFSKRLKKVILETRIHLTIESVSVILTGLYLSKFYGSTFTQVP